MTDLLQAVLVPEAAQILNANMHQTGFSAIVKSISHPGEVLSRRVAEGSPSRYNT